MERSLLAGPSELELEDGRRLRLLSAMEVLEARREAEWLAQGERERALCSNACLLARALCRDGNAVFRDGGEVLEKMTVEEIGVLAGRWAGFNQQVNPGADLRKEQAEELKKHLEHARNERLYWRVLRSFSALPTEDRVRTMKERDFLWCALNLMLDEEQELDGLCPECRERAQEERCTGCGVPLSTVQVCVNEGFDRERFLQLKRGESC